MQRPSRSLCAVVLGAFAVLSSAAPGWAERLEPVGISTDDHHDRVSIDLDSVRASGPYRVASVVSVYDTPRVNIQGVTLDRYVQRTAFDCDAQTVSPLLTLGYLNGKQIAHSVETTDWRSKFAPISDDPMAQAALKAVCSVPLVATPTGAAPPVVRSPAPAQQARASEGSGVVVDEQGFILTDVHVVNGCKAIVVKVVGLDPAAAVLEAADPKNDLALLKTRPGYGAPAVFRVETRPVRLGEGVGVLGYPLAGVLSSEPKASFGEVSSVAGINNDYTLLQFSAPITAGNSGGPVFDNSGHVIGVVESQTSLALAAKIGTVPQNVNFAIKGEIAQIFMSSHGVKFATDKRDHKLETEALAGLGEKSTAQVLCLK